MKIVLSVLACGMLAAGAALACTCAYSPACPALGETSRPVFVGTAVAVPNHYAPFTRLFGDRETRLRVIESFGGIAPIQSEVSIWSSLEGDLCAFPFELGQTYLVEAMIGKDGRARAGGCGFTRKREDATLSLRILRELRDRKTEPSLAGRFMQVDRNPDFLQGTLRKAIANATVRVRGDGRVFETQTDGDGFYSFYHLPQGRYVFSPDLVPAGHMLSTLIGAGPLEPFAVPAGECKVRDIGLFPSGAIRGHVLDQDGRPALGAQAALIPASLKELPGPGVRFLQGHYRTAEFQFVNLSPGDYLLFVNPAQEPLSAVPYRPYFPVVGDVNGTIKVTLRPGEQLTGINLQVRRRP